MSEFQHSRLVADDPGQIEAVMRELYATSRVLTMPTVQRYVQEFRGAPDLNAVQFAFAGALTGSVMLQGKISLGLLRKGRYAYRCAGLSGDSARTMLFPPGLLEATLHGFEFVFLHLDERLVLDYVSALTGVQHRRLHVFGLVPLDPARDRVVRQLVQMSTRELLRPDSAFESAVLRTSISEMVVATLLDAYPIELVLRRASEGGEPAAARRAAAYIEDHAADPVTMADIAASARMSIRGLQALFQRVYGTTPSAYLRRVRLYGARRALLAADPTTSTVAGIARSWGFSSPSRFAVTYRQAFGESPSATLAM